MLVGHRFDYDMNHGRTPMLNGKAKAIVIDVEPEEIGRFHSAEIGIIADAKMALSQLCGALKTRHCPFTQPWLRLLEEARLSLYKEQEPYLNSTEKPIHPLRFVEEVKKALSKEAIVLTGHGAIDFWADPVLQTYLPGHYLRPGQEGPIGAEIPYAVAAKLAHPDKPVLVIVGDGAFGYHCMEFDTAQRYQAPIVCIIGNDCSWGAIAHQQVLSFGRSIATSMPSRNYEKIVEILGGYGEMVTEPTEIGPALHRAFKSGVPACINVTIKSLQAPYLAWRASFERSSKR
jgi:acetolactate synthase-1/2/3 large subunit